MLYDLCCRSLLSVFPLIPDQWGAMCASHILTLGCHCAARFFHHSPAAAFVDIETFITHKLRLVAFALIRIPRVDVFPPLLCAVALIVILRLCVSRCLCFSS